MTTQGKWDLWRSITPHSRVQFHTCKTRHYINAGINWGTAKWSLSVHPGMIFKETDLKGTIHNSRHRKKKKKQSDLLWKMSFFPSRKSKWKLNEWSKVKRFCFITGSAAVTNPPYNTPTAFINFQLETLPLKEGNWQLKVSLVTVGEYRGESEASPCGRWEDFSAAAKDYMAPLCTCHTLMRWALRQKGRKVEKFITSGR